MASVLLDLLRQLAMGAVADEVRSTPQGKSIQNEYVQPVIGSLMDAIIPPAAASDASAIPQGQVLPDVPVGNPVLPDEKLMPADVTLTPEQEQMVMNRIATEAPERPRQAGRTYLPDIVMNEPSTPAMVNVTDEQQVQDTQDFVRMFTPKIAKRARTLMGEAPEGADPQGAAALASIEALAANADKAMDEPMDLGAPVVGPKDVAMGQFPASMTEYSQTAPPPQETKQAGFFDTAGDFFSNLFGDKEKMTRLALAFNSMRYQPDQGLATVLGKQLETLEKTKKARLLAPTYAKKVKDLGFPEYADVILNDPDSAADVFKQVLQKKLEKQASTKTSGVQTDEATGYQYVVKSSPDGEVTVEYIKDAQGNKIKGVSAQQQADIDAAQKAKENDIKLAQDKSETLIEQADNIGSQIRNLEEIDKQIAKGANTGMIANLFPTIRTSTIALQNAVNRLGLDVIGGTTFGALSESELKFALETAVPTNMDEPELQKWVREKIRVQKILERELLASARELSGGMGWGDWVKKRDIAAQESQARQQAAQPQTAPAATAPVKPTAEQQAAAQAELRRRGLIK